MCMCQRYDIIHTQASKPDIELVYEAIFSQTFTTTFLPGGSTYVSMYATYVCPGLVLQRYLLTYK